MNIRESFTRAGLIIRAEEAFEIQGVVNNSVNILENCTVISYFGFDDVFYIEIDMNILQVLEDC